MAPLLRQREVKQDHRPRHPYLSIAGCHLNITSRRPSRVYPWPSNVLRSSSCHDHPHTSAGPWQTRLTGWSSTSSSGTTSSSPGVRLLSSSSLSACSRSDRRGQPHRVRQYRQAHTRHRPFPRPAKGTTQLTRPAHSRDKRSFRPIQLRSRSPNGK